MAQTSRPQPSWTPQQNQSQASDFNMPPAKRQRLSPGPVSPYQHSSTPYGNPSTYNNISIPQGAFNNARPNGLHPQGPGMPPPQAQGSMGPPQRPAERGPDRQAQKDDSMKPIDYNDLTDVFAGTGVNMKDEEDFLNRSYGSSFGRNDNHASSSAAFLARQNGNFDLLSRNTFGSLGGQRSTFPENAPRQTAEEELIEKHRRAAREVSEKQQWHLQDSFLGGASMRLRMQTIARDNTLSLPIEGLFDLMNNRQPGPITGQKMEGSDGGIEADKAPSILNKDTHMEPIMTLLSLAAKERMRGLMEDSYGLARGRQLASDGVVPPQWAHLAIADGAETTKTTPISATGTLWDKVNGHTGDDENTPGPAHEGGASVAQNTIAFTKNPVNNALADLIAADRKREVERLKKRALRRSRKATATAAATASAINSPYESGTPAPDASLAPIVPKQTKKERENAAKKEKDLSEENQAAVANAAAASAIGGKKYSWLTGGSAKAAPKPAFVPRPAGGSNTAQKKKEGLDAIEDRKYGSWREDGVGGKGVQLRDLIGVLEMDGRERKTLQWAYTRLEGGPRDESRPLGAPIKRESISMPTPPRHTTTPQPPHPTQSPIQRSQQQLPPPSNQHTNPALPPPSNQHTNPALPPQVQAPRFSQPPHQQPYNHHQQPQTNGGPRPPNQTCACPTHIAKHTWHSATLCASNTGPVFNALFPSLEGVGGPQDIGNILRVHESVCTDCVMDEAEQAAEERFGSTPDVERSSKVLQKCLALAWAGR